MLYQDAFLADSLSRVVQVDLVAEDSEIIQSATFPIREGKISGALVLSKEIEPGDYALRAYTQWNRNFPIEDQFMAPFVVMQEGFVPEVQIEESEEFPSLIDAKADFTLSDSMNYRVMDLKMDFLDEFENPIDGEFILSISDADQVTEFDSETSLEEAMYWLDEDLPESFESQLTYPIEYGISIQGQFTPDTNRQPVVSPITIVRGDLEDYGQVLPDSAGYFWATGLNYQDTAQIAIAAVDDKLRPFGSVNLIAVDKPALAGSFPRINYQKVAIPTDDYLLDISGDYILLEEFVKEETRERETMAERNYGYGMPDREVTEEQLAVMSPDAIWQRLGYRNGRLGNFNFGMKTGAPLLIIDGAQYPFLSSDDFSLLLGSYAFTELKSIKAYTLSSPVFGMAGFAGVLMIETKSGSRTLLEPDTKFNSEGFQFFDIPGFTTFPEFPKNPSADRYLQKKPTVYWEPLAKTSEGIFEVRVKVPYGIRRLRLVLEGISVDGEVIYQEIYVSLR